MIEIDTKSPAKINLYLRILNKRNDGYHNIETSFQYIDLYDFLNFKESKHDISIDSDSPIFKNTNNTVFKAAIKMKEYSNNSSVLTLERSYLWHLDIIVTGIFFTSVLANINFR